MSSLRLSLSDLSMLQQAASAVAELVSSQAVEGIQLGGQRQRPQCWPNLWRTADG